MFWRVLLKGNMLTSRRRLVVEHERRERVPIDEVEVDVAVVLVDVLAEHCC